MFVNLILCEIFVKGVAVIMSICFVSHMHVVRWQITVRVTDGSMTAQGRALVGGNISTPTRTPPPAKALAGGLRLRLGNSSALQARWAKISHGISRRRIRLRVVLLPTRPYATSKRRSTLSRSRICKADYQAPCPSNQGYQGTAGLTVLRRRRKRVSLLVQKHPSIIFRFVDR